MTRGLPVAPPASSFPATRRVLHALAALLLPCALVSGVVAPRMQGGEGLSWARVHTVLGGTAVLLAVLWIAAILATRSPGPLAMPSWWRRVLAWDNRLILATMVLLGSSGLAMGVDAGVLRWLARGGARPGLRGVPPAQGHAVLAAAVAALALLHVAWLLSYLVRSRGGEGRMGLRVRPRGV